LLPVSLFGHTIGALDQLLIGESINLRKLLQ